MTNRILVVDYEPDRRKFFQLVLGKMGYAVETADNGRDALLQLARSTYAGMLLEIHMPAMNGIVTLELARKLYPSLPIVMMTGNPQKEILDRVLAGGAKEVLVYPLEPERVRQVVERWFRGKTGTVVPPPQKVRNQLTANNLMGPRPVTVVNLIDAPVLKIEVDNVRAVPVKEALRVLVGAFETWYSGEYTSIDRDRLRDVGALFAKAEVVEAPETALAWMGREDAPARREIVGWFLWGFYWYGGVTESAVAALLAAAARCEPGAADYAAMVSALAQANGIVGVGYWAVNAAADEFLKRQETWLRETGVLPHVLQNLSSVRD